MRPTTANAARVRLVIALAVAGAVILMLGLVLLVIGLAVQGLAKHPDPNVIRFGAGVAVGGFAFGMIVLVVFAVLRGATARGRRDEPLSAGPGLRDPAGPSPISDRSGRVVQGYGSGRAPQGPGPRPQPVQGQPRRPHAGAHQAGPANQTGPQPAQARQMGPRQAGPVNQTGPQPAQARQMGPQQTGPQPGQSGPKHTGPQPAQPVQAQS